MPEFTDPTALDVPTDPDLEGLGLGEDDSDLDDLDAELGALEDTDVDLEVPRRAGYAVRCRTTFSGRDVDLIRRRCRDKKLSSGLDGIKFAALLIGANTTAILRGGEELELDGVSPVTFATPGFQQRLGTNSVEATVRAFYGLEGHVDAAAELLMAEAGWGDTVYAADPTA